MLIENPQIYKDINYLLQHDKLFAHYSIQIDEIRWKAFEGGFAGLVRILQGQQISYKVANNLWQKMCKDASRGITLEYIRSLNEKQLKEFGFSKQKQLYLKNLMNAVEDKIIKFSDFLERPNEEVIKLITKIKGFGDWSAQIYLILCLQRRDVFPTKDLVVIKAIQSILNHTQKPTKEMLLQLNQQWTEKQTAATLLLWQIQVFKLQPKV